MALAAVLALQASAAHAACVGGSPNGVPQAGETCDDGNTSNNDYCLNNCTVAACGDNIVCSGPTCALAPGGIEECDTGILRSDSLPDACRLDCSNPSCGDAVTDTGEDCDDGDASNADFCLTTCEWASCGDGFQCTDNSGADQCANSPDLAGVEGCDDGNNSNNDACLNTCVPDSCGDGFVRTGLEQCDDGNGINTDGCANNCTLPFCGNGVVQAGEECDDGNNNNNDLCVACQNAECGDGFVAPAENCDDANNVNTDACKNDCTFATCGDGVTRTGVEQCDDGNVSNADACKNNCTLNTCGDGYVRTGVEQCDNAGANSDTLADACRTNCMNASCGDGVTDTPENCDDDNASNNDACKNDCTFNICGDGHVRNGVEGCDDGNLVNGDTCTAACFPSGCGNGFVDAGEQCDPQVYGTTPPDPLETITCDNNCSTADCGDGDLNTTRGEECDDGNATAGDGCDIACQDEFCGDGIYQPLLGEECDWGGSNNDTLPDYCRTDCKLASCGDGVTDTPENCDDANAVETDACHNDCTFNVCGDGVIDTTQEGCDDGNLDNTDGCTTACVTASCGDGIIQVQDGEQCDNGNDALCVGGYDAGETCVKNADCRGTCSASTPNVGQPCTTATVAADCGSLSGCLMAGVTCADSAANNNSDELPNACRSTCKIDFCGDGVIDAGETCEGPQGAGNPCVVTNAGGQPSPTNCQVASCGDGIVCTAGTCTSGPTGGAEQCDDDNGSNLDGCLNNCAAATCGDGYTQAGEEECDDGVALCFGGYDVGEICTTDADCRGVCAAGTVNPGAPCSQALDVAACGNPGTCTMAGAVCSIAGNNNDQGANDCRSDCQLWFCGDGILDAGEACDDGNTVSTDACKANCTLNVCGDGVVKAGVEKCDDGNLVANDGCSPTCFVEGCGDGVVEVGEQCDPQVFGTNPPVPLETAGCDTDCTFAACYDGTTNATAGEECDDGNVTPNDGCTGCLGLIDFCGDGIDNNGTAEECDNGGANSNTTPNQCRTNCQNPGCGDGVTDNLVTPPAGGEVCDKAGEHATCDDDCTAVSCGDGNVNQAAGEECDNGGGNANAGDACRASTNHVPPYFFDACDLPKNADGLVDPSIGEICDAGPAGDANCNPEGCSTGLSGFVDGFHGAFCQLDKVYANCIVGISEFANCKKAQQILKAVGKIYDREVSAESYSVLGQLQKAQKRNHSALRKTTKLDAKIQERFCPESAAVQSCMDVMLGQLLVEIQTNIEDNLEAINP